MEIKDIEIRDFTNNDYEKVLELWALTDLGSPMRGDNLTVINRTLKQGGKLLVMFKSGAEAMVGTSWMSTDGRRVYIHHFGIHPDFQGHGLSKVLMEASMNFITQLGQQVKLEVKQNNIRAINLYKNYGFNYLGDYLVFINRDISPKNS